jgi:hypothetical protein
MAEEPSSLRHPGRIALALLIGLYLLTLTVWIGFNSLLMPILMLGGPHTNEQAQTVTAFWVAFGVVGLASVAAGWYLAIHWFFEGRDWLLSRQLWIRLLAGVAPLILVAAVIGWFRQYGGAFAVARTLDDGMPEMHWPVVFAKLLAESFQGLKCTAPSASTKTPA